MDRNDPARYLDRLPRHPVRTAEVLAAGVPERSLRRLVLTGALRRPVRGVLVRGDVPDDLPTRAAAARLVLPPTAALCRGAASWLLGVDARDPGRHHEPAPIECYVPRGRQPARRAGLRCYVTDLEPSDVVEVQGLACTTPDRTAVDLGRCLSPGMGLAVLDAMTRAGLIAPAELEPLTQRWRRGRNIATARRLIGLASPLAESYGESWLRLRLHDAGFPPPDLQISMVDADGVEVYRLDLGYASHRASWEYDGQEHHSGAAALAHDARRRADIARRWGWTVWGVTKGEVLGRSMALENAVGDALGIEPAIRRRLW